MQAKRAAAGVASLAIVVLLGVCGHPDRGNRASSAAASDPSSVVAGMVTAAQNFLAGLPDDLRAKAALPYDHDMRLVWHYYPTVAWQRSGVMLKELTPEQKALFRAMLRSGTSERGYETAANLMELEAILREIENTPFARVFRDPERFFLTIFGEPSLTGRWYWKIEGHHFILSYMIDKGRIVSSTPFVVGANPGRVPSGPQRGLRILPGQEDLGRQLFTSLGPVARAKAQFASEPPFDVLTNADLRAKRLPFVGISHAELDAGQQAVLQAILEVYTGLQPTEVSDKLLADIAAAGMDQVHFAWAGSGEPGKPHYYQVHGPSFIVEFCNGQNGGNHIHVAWRDYANDFALGPDTAAPATPGN